MDGTLYLGSNLFSFTKELLTAIKQSGGRYMFMTNNSSKSVADYIKKLKDFGIKADYDEFITSSQATSYFIKKNYNNEKIYVCGTESLKKLSDVCKILLTKENIKYIATNPDYVCPTEFGSVPDCGSFCDMIYNCTGRRPIFIGKPEPIMPNMAMDMTGIKKENTAVIGDRIYTDIKSGINSGVLSVLVMSGETTDKILNDSKDKPDIVLKDAGEIIKILI